MNHDFKSRVIMPIVLPIVVLGAIAAFVGSIALMLLYNTNAGALALAAVVAGGILFTVSLANSQDRLDGPRRGVLLFAFALPLLIGAAIAAGILGDVDDDDRMINVEPLLQIPDDAPLIAAEDSFDFCHPENADCEVLELWEVTPSAEEELLSFVFQNDEAGVPHNVVITELAGTVEEPEEGDELFVESEIVSGVITDYYVDDELTWDDLPDEWYFFCRVHPNMNGAGVVVDAA